MTKALQRPNLESSALEDSKSRYSMSQLRNKIHNTKVADLTITMALTGMRYTVDPDSGAIVQALDTNGMHSILSEEGQIKCLTLLMNKIIGNVPPEKLDNNSKDSSNADWAKLVSETTGEYRDRAKQGALDATEKEKPPNHE